ncbi:hypothetical protein BG004_003530, partial [Podila humilis]
MYKGPNQSSASILPTSGASSPTFRSGSTFGRVLKSRPVRTLLMAYVGFCALFTLKHILTYQAKPEPIVYGPYELQRTYDPEEPYSVVSNLSSSVILSKMFTFHTPDITDNIQPFFVRSTTDPNPDDITLTTFILQDELSELGDLVDRFPGPISAVLHIEHPAEATTGSNNPLKNLATMFAGNPKLRQQVDIHLITTPQTHRQSAVMQQANLHRNLARFFARTDFVLMLDSDGSLPVTNVAKSFKDIPQWMEKLRTGNVFVLPGFNVSMVDNGDGEDENGGGQQLVPALTSSNLPTDKEALKLDVHEEKVVLSEKTWKRTIRNVDYKAWAVQAGTRLSAIQNYDPYFSPSVVIRRDKMLWCPERFGNNQAACLFELYLSGADFWVLPNDFTINQGTRKEIVVTEREKTINTRLYQKFHEESCLKHARAFFAAGEWDSDRARHCRISCQKGMRDFHGQGRSSELDD